MDHGKEFQLMLFVQELLAGYRTNQGRAPHLQSTSRQVLYQLSYDMKIYSHAIIAKLINNVPYVLQNHPIERIWVEINSRVNYPVKACLVKMEEEGQIDMNNEVHKYCVSWLSIRVCSVGARLTVDAWNDHPVPGK